MSSPSPALRKKPTRGEGGLAGPRMGGWSLVLYVLAFFAVYVALYTPVISTLALKVNAISTEGDRAANLAVVTGVGALFALVSNPLSGALSDRTVSRWGMRRPWILGGALLSTGGLAVIAGAPSLALIVVGWCLTQAGTNAALAALQAILPDQIEPERRGRVSGWLGVAGNGAPLVGLGIATLLLSAGAPLFWTILIPTAIGLIGVALYVCFVSDRRLSREDLEPFSLRAFLSGFWINPRRHPDFAWTFAARFTVSIGFALVDTYLIYFMFERFALDEAAVVSLQFNIYLLQTSMLIVGGLLAGYLSDRFLRRKVFVIVGAMLPAVAFLIYAAAPDPAFLLIGAAFYGLGLGSYFAVQSALVTDILPNRDTDAGKDLGVFNIANVLPQSLAPSIAPAVLTIGAAAGEQNYAAVFIVAAVVVVAGSLATLFVRGVR